MKILQNKCIINHKNNKNSYNCISSMIFYVTTNTTTATTVTAAIMIFMQAIVSVNTTETGGHIMPDTEITTTATTTTTATAVTWTKTLFDLSKNPVKAQQSSKISTKTKIIHSTSSSTFNSFHKSPSATETMAKVSAANTALGDCKSLTGAWGDVDPNIFYICDAQTKKPLQLRCPEANGFFLGLGYSGCISYKKWPACILSRHLEQVVLCDSQHMQQPWESINPNKFYVCLREGIEPTILNCELGKGFVHATVITSGVSGGVGDVIGTLEGGAVTTNSEIVGCANWEKWRNYMHCNDYY